jgi:hypothetical protein
MLLVRSLLVRFRVGIKLIGALVVLNDLEARFVCLQVLNA